ncbi:hypothetical protein M2137_002376 [Parabacteroides sp. PFB2-10]|uniref:DUF3575 domain-containing protein n=1 Tax=Parabacteroides sp. PFB2-10 TaxID=1742405 RepID=UPI0024759522|nr:DUF3575 domain-containing protein [Parabacteroides sp. PFB2-10]MDH6313586.1 hypothetical protein [Parabacteroides sp. PFB2-10]
MNNAYNKSRGILHVLIFILWSFVPLHAEQKKEILESGAQEVKEKESPLLAFKTNSLRWIGFTSEFKHTAFTPNLTVEYFISSQWSLQASAMYAYWNYGAERTFWGVSGYSMEPRRWLMGNKNTGLYVGAFIGAGDYDVRNKSKTANATRPTDNYTGKYWQAGLSVGYYWTIYKGLGVETGVRAGYRDSNARAYEWSDPDKFYIGEEKANKWGVMEWNISLAYRF